MRRRWGVLGALVMIVLGAGCDAAEDGGVRGNGDSRTQAVQPSVGVTITVDGTTIAFPAGAVDEVTAVRVESTITPAASAFEAVSPVVIFEPDGLALKVPATVRFPNRTGAATAVVFWSKEGSTSEFELLASSRIDGDEVVAEVTRLSRGFAAVGTVPTE